MKTQNSWICGWQTVHHGNARPGPGNSFKDSGRFQGWRSKMSLDRQKDLLRITFHHVPLEVVRCPHLIARWHMRAWKMMRALSCGWPKYYVSTECC